jgi:hypothetical protein
MPCCPSGSRSAKKTTVTIPHQRLELEHDHQAAIRTSEEYDFHPLGVGRKSLNPVGYPQRGRLNLRTGRATAMREGREDSGWAP